MTELRSVGDAARTGAGHALNAYGLKILSDVPLDEFAAWPADDRAPDVTIRLRPTGRRPIRDTTELTFDFSDDEHFLAWPEVGAFLIRGDSEIDVEPHPEVSPRLINYPLHGPVFAVLLHLRRLLVLHASGVEIDGQCVTFLGDKMAGKSTTAATFMAAGHRMVTDDLLAIDCSGDAPRVLPGPGQIKLSPEAKARVVLPHAEAQPLPVAGFPKHPHLLRDGIARAPLPLARIYALERGTNAALTRLAGRDALGIAMRYSYASRFGTRLVHGAGAARHFADCATLSRTVPTARLETPDDLERLDEVIDLVRRDVREP